LALKEDQVQNRLKTKYQSNFVRISNQNEETINTTIQIDCRVVKKRRPVEDYS